MVTYAALSDEAEKKNLLILNGKDGYTWNGNVYVKYFDEGSLSIKGKSNSRSWDLIGDIVLESGKYIFAELSGVQRETVALEIAFFDVETNNYQQTVNDFGYAGDREFELTQQMKAKVYVEVYPGCNCDVIARLVIFKEGD